MEPPTADTESVPAFGEGNIRGSWPGGPQRGGAPWVRERPPQLQRVEEIEDRSASRTVRMARRARRRRRRVAWAMVCLTALGVGVVAGWQSRTTAADLTAAKEAQQMRNVDISSEINRTLLQLWKMEDLEYARNRR